MRPCIWTDESGLTLVELIVALGLSALLLGLVVTGAVFVEQYVRETQEKNGLTEDLAFVKIELSRAIGGAQEVTLLSNGLIVTDLRGLSTAYSWDSITILKESLPLLAKSTALSSVSISNYDLNHEAPDSTLEVRPRHNSGPVFQIGLKVSSEHGHRDSLMFVVRQDYEHYKYQSH